MCAWTSTTRLAACVHTHVAVTFAYVFVTALRVCVWMSSCFMLHAGGPVCIGLKCQNPACLGYNTREVGDGELPQDAVYFHTQAELYRQQEQQLLQQQGEQPHEEQEGQPEQQQQQQQPQPQLQVQVQAPASQSMFGFAVGSLQGEELAPRPAAAEANQSGLQLGSSAPMDRPQEAPAAPAQPSQGRDAQYPEQLSSVVPSSLRPEGGRQRPSGEGAPSIAMDDAEDTGLGLR
eukprot:GHVT01094586.1.p1 GENE.GHVT01094586.1~~GHVT01094586.1.p1  ORF type:complete len:233 (-),score=53.37 GHVT01094586.1:962-1660(-)